MPTSARLDAIRAALASERLPAAVVDLDAFDRNLDRHAAQASLLGLPLRLATKSLRVVALIRRASERPEMRGLMCFAAREAAALAALGFRDLLVAYPPSGAADVEALLDLVAAGVDASVAVDDGGAILRFSAAAARRGLRLPIVLCVDMSLRLGAGRLHLGVRRSPLHDVQQVLALAEHARSLPGVRVHGLLGYEAQVAGLGDASAFDRAATRAAKTLLRAVSMRELGARRAAIAAELARRGFSLVFVNGGGTGSLDLTTRKTGVTEVAAGSGLFKPLLFDGYGSAFVRALEPSSFFALGVTRRPAPGIVTCFGGGYVASGVAGPDRLPRPVSPAGLALLEAEGAGEVQTPVRGAAADRLALGDAVLFRHAKAGELMERFDEVALVRGGVVVDRVKTYRGEGWCFG